MKAKEEKIVIVFVLESDEVRCSLYHMFRKNGKGREKDVHNVVLQ